MKRIDLRKMRESVEECLRDYPMEIITGVIYFFIKIVTDYNYSISDQPDLSETQAFFPVVLAVTYALNTWVRRKVAAAYYAVPLLMIALFALFYKELHGFIDSMGFGCTLIAAVMLFFACAKNGENRAFSAETLSKAEDLALSVFTGMLFTGVMSAIYGSVEYLFGIVINAYVKTLFFSLYIVMPVLFLTMHGKSSPGPGKFVKVMLNYILHPAILIYAAILYLYAAKIAVEWTLPEGGVAYMVSAFVIASLAGQMLQLVDANPAFAPSYLFDAAYPEALAVLYSGHKVGRLKQAITIARVKPGKAPPEEFYFQRAFFQIQAVEVGNFILPACRRPQRCSFLCNGAIVKIKAGHRIIALGFFRLLFQRCDAPFGIKTHYTVRAGVFHIIPENTGTFLYRGCPTQHGRKALPIKQVIAQNKATRLPLKEIGTQHKGLRQPVGFILHLIIEAHAQILPGAQQVAEHRQVPRGGNNEHLADAGQHQRRERIVNHGLVVDGHYLLGDGLRQRVEAGGAATGKNNSFHTSVYLLREKLNGE